MIRIYFEVAFGFLIIVVLIVSGIHSFNVSEAEREDDISLNPYGVE